jgi:sucrose-6F-phosphate phosphohydrolase
MDMNTKWTIASDIDGTLVGDREALDRLTTRLRKARAHGRVMLVLSTGRRLEQVIDGVAQEGLPEPDAVLCQVGTEIYLPPLQPNSIPMAAWRERLLMDYSRDEAESFLQDIEGLVMQPDVFNTELKTSCYLDSCGDPEAAASEIRRRVAPHTDRYQVIWSSGRDLDILPAASGKGKAIRFLVEHLGLDADHVVVAGDTGNDATMFEEFGRGVVVGNARPELVELAESLGDGRAFRARRDYAAGVEEGLEYFGVLESSASGG